jgi:hypothetical protein
MKGKGSISSSLIKTVFSMLMLGMIQKSFYVLFSKGTALQRNLHSENVK